MTGQVVVPVIPPSPRSKRPGRVAAVPSHRRVSVPRLQPARERSSVYAFGAVDHRGRSAVRLIFDALGWGPGAPVTVREQSGLVVVVADPRGETRLTPEGHLRIPFAVRQWCGLAAGTRVLLVADPGEHRLVVHPVASLDTMISRLYAEVFGGDEA